MFVQIFRWGSAWCLEFEISPIRQCHSNAAVLNSAEIDLFRRFVSDNLIKPANELRQGDVKPIAPELNATDGLQIRVVEPFADRTISRRV